MGQWAWLIQTLMLWGEQVGLVAFPSGGASAKPGGVCLTSSTVGEAIGSIGGVSGGGPNNEGVVPCAPRLWQSLQCQLWWTG